MSHFNHAASSWDSEGKIKFMGELARKAQSHLNISEKIDILDFGCGTGLFGLEFADHAKSLLGIDTSTGMLEVFDNKTKEHAHINSLNTDLENEDIDHKFDLIVSSMTFHHLDDPKSVLAKLRKLLRPNGQIAIVDLDEEDGTFHSDNAKAGVKHFGFSNTKLSNWAKELELESNITIIDTVEKNDKSYNQFLAVFKNLN